MQSIKRYMNIVLSSELIKVEFSNCQFFQSTHGESKERTTVKSNDTGGV